LSTTTFAIWGCGKGDDIHPYSRRGACRRSLILSLTLDLPRRCKLDRHRDVESAVDPERFQQAGRWDVVSQLASELEARWLTRFGNVLSLDAKKRQRAE
jgi:hypothetical protein